MCSKILSQNYFSPFSIVKNIAGGIQKKLLSRRLLLIELLEVVDEKGELLALVLKEVGVEGGVDGELVEGAIDLGEFSVDVGKVKRLT